MTAKDHAHPMAASSPPPPWWGPAATEEVGLLRPFVILARHYRLVSVVTLGATVLAVALALLLPRSFVGTARLVPEQTAGALPGNLAGLAGRLGVNLDLGGSGHSPQFYASLLRDPAILEPVVSGSIDTGGVQLPVLDALQVDAEGPVRRVADGVELLSRIVDVRVDVATNIVTLGTEWTDPQIAAAVTNQLVRELARFNVRDRATTAKATREFLELRLEEAREHLEVAEDSLRRFLERNRRVEAPDLVFQQQRLQRVVDLKSQILQTLQQEYEQARIQEVNTTPTFSVIRWADPPAKRSRPQRRRIVLVGAILGLVAGVLAAFGAEYLALARARRDPDLAALRAALGRSRSAAELPADGPGA